MKTRKQMAGKTVIIRTESAGVWYGTLSDSSKSEVLLVNARRMYFFKTLDDGYTLSHIVLSGIHPDSKIQAPIEAVLLQWIEILPCTDIAIATFNAQPYAKKEV